MKTINLFQLFIFLSFPFIIRAEVKCNFTPGNDISLLNLLQNTPFYRNALIGNLKEKNFICTKKDDTENYTCVGKIPDNPKRVTIIIPGNISSFSKLNLHLHGDLQCTIPNACPGRKILSTEENYDLDMNNFRFDKLMPSHTNSILVVPESDNYNQTYNQHLIDAKKFESFSKNLMNTIIPPIGNSQNSYIPPKGITLSAHSSAGYRTSRLLQIAETADNQSYLKQINKTHIFDGVFDSIPYENILSWAKKDSNKKVNISYNDSPGYTKSASELLMEKAKKSGINNIEIHGEKPGGQSAISMKEHYSDPHYTTLTNNFYHIFE